MHSNFLVLNEQLVKVSCTIGNIKPAIIALASKSNYFEFTSLKMNKQNNLSCHIFNSHICPSTPCACKFSSFMFCLETTIEQESVGALSTDDPFMPH